MNGPLELQRFEFQPRGDEQNAANHGRHPRRRIPARRQAAGRWTLDAGRWTRRRLVRSIVQSAKQAFRLPAAAFAAATERPEGRESLTVKCYTSYRRTLFIARRNSRIINAAFSIAPAAEGNPRRARRRTGGDK